MLQRIVHQEIRSAKGPDWHAVMVMAELLRRHDRTQAHPALDGAHVFVATRDETIIGMIAAHEPKDGICTVSNLYVLQAHRHRGIGTALHLPWALVQLPHSQQIRRHGEQPPSWNSVLPTMFLRATAHIQLLAQCAPSMVE